MPVKTVTFGVSTTNSAVLCPLSPSSLSKLSLQLFPCHSRCLSTCTLLYILVLLLTLFFFTVFCSALKKLSCIFSDVMHLPVLTVFILSHQTVMGHDFHHWLRSISFKHTLSLIYEYSYISVYSSSFLLKPFLFNPCTPLCVSLFTK